MHLSGRTISERRGHAFQRHDLIDHIWGSCSTRADSANVLRAKLQGRSVFYQMAIKTALTNVRVFDGTKVCEPSTVVIDGDLIGHDATGAHEVDVNGHILLPGYIDAHVHLDGPENLEKMSHAGITTAFDMGTWPSSLLTTLRHKLGSTDIRSAGIPATSPGSIHSHIPGRPAEMLVSNPTEATQFVADRVAEGSDYIKVIADIPGPDQSTLNALVAAAHNHGKLVIAHAVTYEAAIMALEAKADVLTHAPLDKPLGEAEISPMKKTSCFVVPTLIMMKETAKNLAGKRPGLDYANANATVGAWYRAGIPVLAGTDSNRAAGVPANIPHGESLHDELRLLVEAGLSTVDALRAATSLPAKHFGLHDRGVVAPGRRADLVLLTADPTEDIQNTRKIKQVWCGGIPCIQ